MTHVKNEININSKVSSQNAGTHIAVSGTSCARADLLNSVQTCDIWANYVFTPSTCNSTHNLAVGTALVLLLPLKYSSLAKN